MLKKIAQKDRLTLGLVFPLESYNGSVPKMEHQEKLAKRAEELGFKALWFRDVPFNDPSFGDAGQLYDPWIYMTHIMNHTKTISLATGSIILPLRHPVHIAKSIQSLQQLSKGRLILGTASGDRPIEYPAFNYNLENKSELFRDSFFYIKALQKEFPIYESKYYGKTNGRIDVLPKSQYSTSMLVTGHSGQSLDWIAEHADGWLYYPRDFNFLKQTMTNWSHALEKNKQSWKPYMQSLYIDLIEEKNATPKGIHLGFKSGSEYAIQHLKLLENNCVNHVIINLKYGSRPAEIVIEELGNDVLPHFI
ncbi:luciferase-type oxidoreductase, BA3436 family [Aquimarina amphilecti]|uniref:Luciferase-type oxidoreductase, BA3436 family n=1 Tax=Aquimarina amphilecti TaxID=1038014 RepID=A0A1H7TDG3_AQUAM|nr:LLM class oxidoreductase [Aquimarina amphilecti]SEL82922.1 luciferase-type oxidoreductase, BA3436 family [Aquimarina amphilecti]